MVRDDQVLQRSAFRHRLHSLAGKEVEVDLVDGSRAVGVLHTTTLYPNVRRRDVVLKAARVFGKGGELDNKVQPGSTLVLDFGNIVALSGQVTDASSLRQRGADFETDANIRKHGDLSHLQGRELVSVSTTWLDPETLTSLEGEAAGVSTGTTTGGGVGGAGTAVGGSKDWDQFETNRRLFNVSTTYDENLYTKRIDHNSVTAEQLARAERLAREIEGSATGKCLASSSPLGAQGPLLMCAFLSLYAYVCLFTREYSSARGAWAFFADGLRRGDPLLWSGERSSSCCCSSPGGRCCSHSPFNQACRWRVEEASETVSLHSFSLNYLLHSRGDFSSDHTSGE